LLRKQLCAIGRSSRSRLSVILTPSTSLPINLNPTSAYPGHARVNGTKGQEIPTFYSKSHMVIFVQPFEGSNQTWIVDVGFGSPGLSRPILLSSEEKNVVRGAMSPEMHRLVRCTHPESAIGMFI
jgi:hypothetical protein